MPGNNDAYLKRIRGTTKGVEQASRELRKSLTPAEEILWQALRGRRLEGLKFRRQHPVGKYVLDFYCPEYRLVIELDGEIHDHQQEYDQIRTEHLAAYGYRVIRFRNEEVFNNLTGVLEVIRLAAQALTPGPSPNTWRGE
ncbi:MAG: endonuclease domain-containing protein [Armatimonadota bacterium]